MSGPKLSVIASQVVWRELGARIATPASSGAESRYQDISSALWVAPWRKISKGSGASATDFGNCRIASRSRSSPRLICRPTTEVPSGEELAKFLSGAVGRAVSLPSFASPVQLRRQATFNMSDVALPAAIAQKLRLFMRLHSPQGNRANGRAAQSVHLSSAS